MGKIAFCKMIPKPLFIKNRVGNFDIISVCRIVISAEIVRPVAVLLRKYLSLATGYEFPIAVSNNPKATDIYLNLLDYNYVNIKDEALFSDESYELVAGNRGLKLSAVTPSGLVRGIQALRQLLPFGIFLNTVQSAENWIIEGCRIKDKPRFKWRGMHLDISRHFFPVEDVCRFIDLIALHRFNILHLHLTDDQGWRVEIKRYPKLTEIGSRRKSTLIGHERGRPRQYNNISYRGHYSQDDVRKIVAYAAERFITVVPEIDMPGHMQAAISAYPELGCTDMTISPRCHWGVSQHILNAGESTVKFMQNVLDEIMDMFPSKFIHVGGDEAAKYQWEESPTIQKRMEDVGAKNEGELQSWFISQMDKYLTSKGRRLIGWDEILEGGLAEGAAVMSWRGEGGGVKAADLQHDVVMTPGEYVYFDHYQAEPTTNEPLAIGGMNTLEKVYSYEPIPKKMEEDKKKYILGAQGQLWTEYISTRDHLDYMAFPRVCALAEVLWLNADQKNYRNFIERLTYHRKRLKALGVNAHL